MKTRWYKEAVFYQIWPRSFCDSNGDGIGDLQGIISKIDYLKDLGIDALWLSPVYKSPNYDMGYDISDYMDIMDEFGTLEDWKELADELHKRDMKIIMDLVVNHTSIEHEWFKESKKSKDNPYRDYYIWRKGRGKDGKKAPNNWTSNFSGPAWTYSEDTAEHYMHLFLKQQPDLNWDNPKVRKEVSKICNFWCEMGIDGFRCDVIPYISKREGLPNGKIFTIMPIIGLEHYVLGPNWDKYIKELGDTSYNQDKYDTVIIGEGAGVSLEKMQHIVKEGNGLLDTIFQFDHINTHFTLAVFPKRKLQIKKMKNIFHRLNDSPENCWNTIFYENHDLPRSVSLFRGDKDDGKYSETAAKMLAASFLLQRPTPFIYQGQELGMTNYEFTEEEYKDNASLSILSTVDKYVPFMKKKAIKLLNTRGRDSARICVPWTDEKHGGFTTGTPWFMAHPDYKTLNAKTQMENKDSVLNFYKEILKIRKQYKTLLHYGKMTPFMEKSNKVFTYMMEYKNKALVVLCNFSNKNSFVVLPKDINYANSKLLISNYKNEIDTFQNMDLKPFETRVYELS